MKGIEGTLPSYNVRAKVHLYIPPLRLLHIEEGWNCNVIVYEVVKTFIYWVILRVSGQTCNI